MRDGGGRALIIIQSRIQYRRNARDQACESNKADRYQVIATPPLVHRKGHAESGDYTDVNCGAL
jgi:hypothetical protein